jgi:hypothetical protein
LESVDQRPLLIIGAMTRIGGPVGGIIWIKPDFAEAITLTR